MSGFVRSWLEADHLREAEELPLMTQTGHSGRPALRNEPNAGCSRHSQLVARIVAERMEMDAAFVPKARGKFV